MTARIRNLLNAILGVMIVCAIPACKKEPSAPAPRQTSKPSAAPEPAPSAVISDLPVLAAKPATEADQAWEKLQAALQGPDYPAEWQIKQPSEEEFAEFRRKNAVVAGETADKAREFYKKYPDHEQAAEAKKQEHQMLGIAVQLGNTNRVEDLRKLEQAQLDDPNVSEDDRYAIRMEQLQRAVSSKSGGGQAAMLQELEKQARALQKEFPKRDETSAVLLETAERWLDLDIDKSRKLVDEVLKDGKLEPEIKGAAEALQKKINRVGKPLDLKFTAIDGREVNVQKMAGKVVLVDFWATWCAPCMAELPKVKAAYDKLHGKGFEIIGISFDQDRRALEKTLKEKEMSWPQFFDEENGGQTFGEEFGIEGIPTMWLVDKKGLLRELNAREDLAAKVEKLLKE